MPRTVPVMLTEVPGNFITGALWNAQVAALGNFTTGFPFFAGYQASVQTLTTSVWTPITMDTETIDTDGGHSTVTNTSRYFAQVAGVYLVWGTVAFANNVTGLRASKLSKNGTTIVGSESFCAPGPSVGSSASSFAAIQLAVGDYVDCFGFQASGGNLATANNGECASNLTCLWIRT